MTAAFNLAWRIILCLLLMVIWVELCSCRKTTSKSNLEGSDENLQERKGWSKSSLAFQSGAEKSSKVKMQTLGVGAEKRPNAPKNAGNSGVSTNENLQNQDGHSGLKPSASGTSVSANPPKGADKESAAPDPGAGLGGTIVMPVLEGSGGESNTDDKLQNVDTTSHTRRKHKKIPKSPRPNSPTDPKDQDPLQDVGSDTRSSGTEDSLTNINMTEFLTQHCGKAHSRKRRIVGGTVSSVTMYPWTVGIFMVGSSKPYCGAVLITPWFVLTAAHCTRGRVVVDLRVAYGLQTINARTLEERREHVATVKQIHQHQRFQDIVHGDDISVLELASVLRVDGQLVTPICTPQGSQLDRSTVVGTTGVVAGWGRTSYNGESSTDLREVSLPIVSNERCSEVFKDVVTITEGMICAGDITGKKDACQGDSGGPLMWYSSTLERWFVIGVVSFGVKCAEKGYYGTYTWVEKYLRWLCKVTGGAVCLQSTGARQNRIGPAKPAPGKGKEDRNEARPNGSQTDKPQQSDPEPTTPTSGQPSKTTAEQTQHAGATSDISSNVKPTAPELTTQQPTTSNQSDQTKKKDQKMAKPSRPSLAEDAPAGLENVTASRKKTGSGTEDSVNFGKSKQWSKTNTSKNREEKAA